MQKIIYPPRRIAIINVYDSENRGDAALTTVLVNRLRKLWPQAHLLISSMEYPEKTSFEGVSLRPSFSGVIRQRLNIPILHTLYTFYVLTASNIWWSIYSSTEKKASFLLPKSEISLLEVMCDSDLIVSVGGGYLRARPTLSDTINLLILLHPIRLAAKHGKAVIMDSQSFGPFPLGMQRHLVRHVLNMTDLVLVREDTSLSLLAKIGVKANLMHRTVDSGFLFKPKIDQKFLKSFSNTINTGQSKLVGITVRQWLNDEEQDAYETEMAKFVDYIVKNTDMRPIFIPQVTSDAHGDDDRVVADRIVAKTQHPEKVIVVERRLTHYEIKTLYSLLTCLIGTRFHSVIFSLTSSVPAIAIEYEHKTSGIMHSFGLDEWVTPMDTITHDTLILLYKKLISANGSSSYKKKLSELNTIIDNYDTASGLFVAAYDGHVASSQDN